MTNILNGKTALVTGASSGIGESTAALLAELGANVVTVARRKSRLDSIKHSSIYADRIHTIEADIGDAGQAKLAIIEAHEHFGRLDILVNNAGVMLLGPFEDVEISEWEKMVKINILGVMYCTHAAIPFMKAQGSGHIVNMSSVAGRINKPTSAVYNATKWAVGAFSESIRQALHNQHIRVTIIEPGAVATELTDHIPHGATKEQIKNYVGSITPLASKDIANAIIYAVTQPAHVNVNEILIRPTDQLS